jgi:hypothetical protein
MKVIFINGLAYSGTTKFGEYLLEKLASEGKKVIYLGETFTAFQPAARMPFKEWNENVVTCSCGKHISKCDFWAGSPKVAFWDEAYDWVINKAEEKGYDYIIDSSKRIRAWDEYIRKGIDVEAYYCIRRFKGWMDSVKKRKDWGTTKCLWGWIWGNYIQKKSMKKRGEFEVKKNKWFDVKGIYNEHKHIFASNINKRK